MLTILIFIMCQFAALLPLVTSQTWLRSDVLEPQPGLTAGESRMFLAVGVLDRFPAVNSASLHRLGYVLWRPLIVHVHFRELPFRWLPVGPS